MSRSANRARRRRVREELAHAQKEQRRADFEMEFQEALRRLWSATNSAHRVEITEKLIELIHRIADDPDVKLWPFRDLLFNSDSLSNLTPEERAEFQAIFAQAVAPQLAGMTSGNVHKKHARGRFPEGFLSTQA